MKKVLFLCFFGSIPSLFLCIAMYIYDPLQLYHLPYFREKNILSTNMRYQSAGLIHSWDFDSIILGTSMLENTSSKEAENKLGGKWINLSIAGGSPYERKIIFQHAILHKQIRAIIFSLEPYFFNNPHYYVEEHYSFAYLHNNNHFDDFSVYFQENYLLCLFKLSQLCIKQVKAEYPRQWIDTHDYRSRGLKHWILKNQAPFMRKILNDIVNQPNIKVIDNIQNLKNMIKKTLIEMIDTYPNINFYIILAPHTTLYYHLKTNDKSLFHFKEIIKLLLEINKKNLRIYGFDNQDFTNDLNYYYDYIHFDERINSFMLDAIKNDTHRITLENVDNYFEEMRKKVEAYNIEPLRKQIIESGVLNH